MLRNLSLPPQFSLPDYTGAIRSLRELRGDKSLVLLFFRGAFCATACRDLLAYSDIYERMRGLGAELVAVSVDTPSNLRDLRLRLGLEFPLLSDVDFAVSGLYGVYASDETDEGPQPHGEPAVWVLDPQGRVIFSQIQSGPKGAAPASEILLMLLYLEQHEGRYW